MFRIVWVLAFMLSSCGDDKSYAPVPNCGMYVHGENGKVYLVPYSTLPIKKGMYGYEMGNGSYWIYKADGSMIWVNIDGFGCA